MTVSIAAPWASVAGGPGARRAPGGEREGQSHLVEERLANGVRGRRP